MGKYCKAFEMKDPKAAYMHILNNTEVVKVYGKSAYGHLLHTWDDGERILYRCKECGKYILLQSSEFHGMEDDDYYSDYFFLESIEEAEEINKKYDGFEVENKFPRKYLKKDNRFSPYWSSDNEQKA